MSGIVIKEYDDQYKDEVISLILDIQQREFGIPISREDQPDLSDITNFYQTHNGNFWLALDRDGVVGTISLLDIGHDQGALRKLFVQAPYRGRPHKTGQLLLQRLMDWARQKAMRQIYLGTTAKFLAAHRFYEKNGFASIVKGDLPAAFPLMKVDTKFYQYDL